MQLTRPGYKDLADKRVSDSRAIFEAVPDGELNFPGKLTYAFRSPRNWASQALYLSTSKKKFAETKIPTEHDFYQF